MTTTRVLYVHTATRPPLGADTWIHTQIIRHLDRSDVDIYVACQPIVGGVPTPTYEAIRDTPDVTIVRVRFGTEFDRTSVHRRVMGLFGALASLPSLAKLVWLVRRRGISIVHTSDRPRDAFASVLLARLTGSTSVVHVHVGYNPTWMGRMLRWSLAHADALVAVSRFVASTLVDAGIDPARVHVVLNAIDVSRWSPGEGREAVRSELGCSDETPVVVTVCRLFPAKGVRELIEAIGRVRSEVSEVVLLIVGEAMDTTYGDELVELVAKLGLTDSVRFLGRRPDVAAVMAAADVFAMPSHEEPFGLVFVEAMAMRLPVVALADSGTVEILEHGRSGLLSRWGDIDQLAADLRTLLVDPELRSSMGTYGRRRVEHEFTVERMAADVERLYPLVASEVS